MVRGQVVPDGWAAHHRPVVAGFFCDTVTVERVTGTTDGPVGTKHKIWSPITPAGGVPALVQVNVTVSNAEVDSAGFPLLLVSYIARLDVDWLPDDGDRLTVIASPDPANLGVYDVRRRESQGHVVDRTVHLSRISKARP